MGTEGSWQNLAASIHTGVLISTSVSQFVLALRPNLLQALWVVFCWKAQGFWCLLTRIPGQASSEVSPSVREQNACPIVPEFPRLVGMLVIADRWHRPWYDLGTGGDIITLQPHFSGGQTEAEKEGQEVTESSELLTPF